MCHCGMFGFFNYAIMKETSITSEGIKLTQHPHRPESICEIIYRGMAFSAKDFGENQMDAWRYGTTLGWDEESFKEFKLKFGWTDNDVAAIEELRQKFIEVENKYYR